MGGFFSSLNDLSQLGRSILNSTLLTENITWGWLKPTPFTSDPRGAVGRPWEIFRVDTIPNRSIIDVFGKGGSIGLYQTWFGVIPNYNVGISSVVAGGGTPTWMNSLFVEIVVPVLEATAREQANATYAGTYTATNGLNSSLTLITEPDLPGLGVKQWISNGTDFLTTLSTVIGTPLNTEFLRLFPTNVNRKTGNGTEIVWCAVPNADAPGSRGHFAARNSWFGLDGPIHGDFSFDSILFKLDAQGKAKSVSPRAFRIELTKDGQ